MATKETGQASVAELDPSEQRLRELGYKQELKRELTSFTNFSVSFSIVSVLTGLSSLYGTGLVSGGPVVIIWGWCLVSLMTGCVAAAMAEICSGYPTSGGLYFWSARLAGPRWGPLASWITGWFNLLGQFACTAGIDFGLAIALCATVSIGTDFAFEPSPGVLVLVYIALLVVHGLLNTFAVRAIAILNTISVWWHIVGVLAIIISVLVGADQPQSGTWVFSHFANYTGWDNAGYVALLGLLMSQFTMTGYDASAHMTEETKRADVAGPIGILMAVGVSFVAGLAYLLGLTFAIQDYDRVVGSRTGMAVAQIFLDALGRTGAILLLVIVMGAMFFAGNASVTSNSRMLYAFSRDGAVPGSRYWHQINQKRKSPVNAVWCAVGVAAVLGLPYLGNSTAFTAITSLATIGLYISYGLPILCRVWRPQAFEHGPLHLGRLGRLIGIVACLWVAFITVLFVLPTASPVTAENMNYAPVMVGIVLVFVGGWWMLSARHWFHGPVCNVTLDTKATVSATFASAPLDGQAPYTKGAEDAA
ncbi:APC amino acid permease [Thamnocephalis sphaerospora]|uniref:APC amino acid permease n=1 Tax=Thamnocephalis sphaerospora TaxID=78915 RepID=A0A4V1IW68_9FUNG|nr:APC amino acid permease [Thamnocephalis sphaerospora]|eukprot:RKP06509.1 APC amino acid permease [Thamnocephalis sphaerospora]